jgi:hypothetical protein
MRTLEFSPTGPALGQWCEKRGGPCASITAPVMPRRRQSPPRQRNFGCRSWRLKWKIFVGKGHDTTNVVFCLGRPSSVHEPAYAWPGRRPGSSQPLRSQRSLVRGGILQLYHRDSRPWPSRATEPRTVEFGSASVPEPFSAVGSTERSRAWENNVGTNAGSRTLANRRRAGIPVPLRRVRVLGCSASLPRPLMAAACATACLCRTSRAN